MQGAKSSAVNTPATPGHGCRYRSIDRNQPCMGDGTAHEGQMQHVRHGQGIDKAPAPGNEAVCSLRAMLDGLMIV